MDSKLLTKKEEFFSPEDKFEIGAVLVLVGQAAQAITVRPSLFDWYFILTVLNIYIIILWNLFYHRYKSLKKSFVNFEILSKLLAIFSPTLSTLTSYFSLMVALFQFLNVIKGCCVGEIKNLSEVDKWNDMMRFSRFNEVAFLM